MRISFASLAALAVLAIATPAIAQSEAPVTPTPVAKPKPGTVAYCNALKSTTSKTACLKRVHAQAAAHSKPVAKTPAKTTAKKPPAAAQLSPTAATPAPRQTAAAPAQPSPPQTIQVPPLPQKTI